MPTLTPIDFDPFYDATGADKPTPVGKTQLLGNILFGALPGPSKLATLPLNENFRKGFMEGMEKSGSIGIRSYYESLENQYIPDGAVAVNDAGEWLDKDGKILLKQRKPNILPITKIPQKGDELNPLTNNEWILERSRLDNDKPKGWFGSNFEGAMPAMADVWNTMGGVAGKGGVSLGAGPMLRPALKYQDKIYKAKEGQQHLDALPPELYETFQKQAMSGEDISNFNFGFINHKGQFLSREKALEYAINEGILDPNDAKYGTLVTTMLNDSGGGQKLASQAAAQSREMKYPLAKHDDWWGQRQYDQQGGRMETMSPDEFLNKSRPLKIDESSRENIEELKQHILSGKTLDPLNLQQGGKEDGRHRAIAAKELGIKEVPVINFRPAPTFYSATEKAVEGIKQNKASGDQWLSTIGNQKGVKGEELEWIGLKDFLAGKQSVTKQEIQNYLKNNKVELQEVWKGTRETKLEQWKVIRPDGHVDSTWNNPEGAAKRAKDIEGTVSEKHETKPMDNTKYSQWQLPGGENYRELLLTLPDKFKDDLTGDKLANKLFGKDMDRLTQPQRAEVVNNMNASEYKSSHWNERNILAHMRMNDRTIDGKKSLHLEEIQSDWHQQGRDKGYSSSKSKAEFDKLNKEFEDARSDLGAATEKKAVELLGMSYQKYRAIYPAEKDDALKRLKEYRAKDPEYVALEKKVEELEKAKNAVNPVGGVPDAPFKKTWHELALKRAIREAAENGYERLSWTPGEAQAARYNLSKQLKELQYLKNDDGTYEIAGITSKGDGFNHPEKLTAAKLPDVVGKEMAEKIIKNEGKRNRGQPSNGGYFDGVDLKIGGEGMKGFYDQIIPKSVEKIAKEFGVKVQKGETGSGEWLAKSKNGSVVASFKNKEEADYWLSRMNKPDKDIQYNLEKSSQPIYYIDIPENMRQSIVGKGQPLFSGNPVLVPIDYNPFEENEK